MNYRIVTDSSANLRGSSAQFASVPLKIITSDCEFVDDDTLDTADMISYLKNYKGRSSTACPCVADWLAAFDDADSVFCFTITSTLSGSYNAARLAKEDYEAAHPGRCVYLLDTLSTGGEMKLLVERTEQLLARGEAPAAVYEDLCDYRKKTHLIFALQSLNNLANNGRVNPLIAKISGALGMRIIGRASDHGDLETLSKCRGEKKALEKIVHHMQEMNFNGGAVRIDHCLDAPAAVQLKELIEASYPGAEVTIGETGGLCSFYAEKGGMMLGFETF